ncbi:sugar ABC transporter permease [Paenibacillus validus]|nr:MULTISPECIES: sugar ABC transporter permease [Paenibacillus]MED4599987.1 sugar ABC transporter permease [Paenibacillus validus]MED4605745.1 sugar ABC transporter permease [Paenibacillus validus]
MTKIRIKPVHLLFVLPAVLLNLIFFIYPLIRSLIMSFYNWPVLGEKTFIGLDNYIDLFKDKTYWSTLWFTLKYTLMVTPLIFIVAFGLALLINKRLPGIIFFRSVYFTPVVISMVSSSLVWLWIYNDLYGLLNYYLLEWGLIQQPIVWMGDASTSLPAIVLMIAWKTSGFTMIILLAGLQSIPQDIYEAANVDGARRWQVLRYITLPLLRPSFALALILSVIGSVLAFEQFVIMTQGGPSNTTTTVVHLIYKTSFKYFHLGYGSVMTFVLLFILIILSLIQMRILRNPVNY